MIQEMIDAGRTFCAEGALCTPGKGLMLWKSDEAVYVTGRSSSLNSLGDEDIIALDASVDSFSLPEAGTETPEGGSDRQTLLRRSLLQRKLYPDLPGEAPLLTPLYELSSFPAVIQSSHYLISALVSGRQAKAEVVRLFGEEAVFIPFTADPVDLIGKTRNILSRYRKEYDRDPKILAMQNRGMAFAGETLLEASQAREAAIEKIRGCVAEEPDLSGIPVSPEVKRILPAVRMMLSDGECPMSAGIRNDGLISWFMKSRQNFKPASSPLIPEHAEAVLAGPLLLTRYADPDKQLAECGKAVQSYAAKYGFRPKVILVPGLGAVAVDVSAKEVERSLDLLSDHLKACYFSANFGGPKALSNQAVSSVLNPSGAREVSPFVRCGQERFGGRVLNRVALVTGGSQGFGRGIAERLFSEGANVVIVDLNEEKGAEVAGELNSGDAENRAIFVAGNVTDLASMEAVAERAVREFGGVDLLVSNAGVLRAGGIDDMTPEVFDMVTSVNYKGFFICVKAVAGIMKLQSKYNPGFYADIIQINSKSGLEGSKRNFAYAGGKFGGIGLVQSFALELVEDNVKVNAICPGNFFEGPLWSDPKNGLFVQYLEAKKVPGAKTVEDVKRFYESKVPMNRGCRVEDVMRALFYIVEQKYETGQAVPVTGGQIMLK